MQLTLRTLLAWLDDTLSPGEVREIGKQVGESPFAKELVDKIHKVTRQRRLTVPRTGPESVDPNVVARYLDNELDAEDVTELEKRCLASDVHLAEVASVHQILSLIGQKAKVPVEARNRMYHLIKGRESVKPSPAKAPRRAEPRKVAEPISPWVTPEPPARPWVKQFGPAALVVAMIAVLGLTAWKSMSLPDPTTPPPETLLADSTPVPATEPRPIAEKPVPRDAEPAGPDAKDQSGKTAADDATKPGERLAPPPEKETPEPTQADVTSGGVGQVKKPTGVLLRYSPSKREWERLTEPTSLREQDRLLSLAPFRSTVEVGSAGVDLVGEAEVWVGAAAPSLAAKLSVSQGRVVLHGGSTPLPFEVQFGGKAVKVTPPPGGTVGVERLNRRGQGEPVPSAPVLKLYAADGTVKLSDGTNEEALKGPGSVTFEARGKFTDRSSKPVPTWVSETSLTAFEENLGEQYLKFFRPGRQVVSDLVEAYDDENKDITRASISALRAVGDVTFIVPLLNTTREKNAATKRRAAIQVLRAYLTEGPDAFKKLDKYLLDELGSELTPKVEKLLVGFTPKEAAEEATYARLIQYLSSTDDAEVCVRELALDNLQELTGRDTLDYDPEKPDGKGLKAWKDLNHAHELKPASGSLKAAK